MVRPCVHPLRPLVILALGVASVGCGPKFVRQEVFRSENNQVRVELRRTEQGGEAISQDYEHPATIAAVRVAHILATLGYENSDGKDQSVIRGEHLYPLADGISKALAEAGPGDEVAAAALSQDRKFGVFTSDRATAFQLFMRDDQLHISFYAIEQPLEKPGVTDEIEIYKIPREFPTRRPPFALLPGKAQARTGARTLVIEWRSPVYRKALRLGRYGRGLRRRQVLMELPEEEKVNPAEVGLGLPAEVTDAQIHALDQLDAARRGGLVTELEFQRRRRLILQGRLEEAGYETPAP